MVFEKKELEKPKRVCLRLKEARKAAGMTLADLSQKTKISKRHLKALEECRFQDIPYALVYQKNFVRQYAEALDIPSLSMLEQFLAEEAPAKQAIRASGAHVHKHRFHNLPAIIKGIVASLVVLMLIGYLGWQVRAIIKPPALVVYGPRDGHVTATSNVMVHGETGKEARVYINGQEISTKGNGRFEEKLDLSPGINTIIISAKKRHGKVTEMTRHVIVKQNHQFSLK